MTIPVVNIHRIKTTKIKSDDKIKYINIKLL